MFFELIKHVQIAACPTFTIFTVHNLNKFSIRLVKLSYDTIKLIFLLMLFTHSYKGCVKNDSTRVKFLHFNA